MRTTEPTRIDARILTRVRALLAKAESTTFPEEAEALTAKAQQLMGRYAIDQALVDEAGGHRGSPSSRAFQVPSPYATPKFCLLAAVASANRCRAVWSKSLKQAPVFGFEVDLEAVEILYTSLLMQSTTAMVRERAPSPSRVKAFRHAFLLGFAGRIGERLTTQAELDVEEAAAEHGQSVLPVLASRADEVDAAMRDAFPDVGTLRVTASSGLGAAAGRSAADRADLGGLGVGGGGRRSLGAA